MSDTDGWDTMEDANMVVTDVGILSKKERVLKEYTVIENTHDGKKANFPEGKLGFTSTTRYICYTKKTASPARGFVVVTDLKVLPMGDRSPQGYLPFLHTMDDTSAKSFSSKQLLARFVALPEAKDAIVDIIVLSANHKEAVPPKYKRLPEINGFSICFKMGPVPKKSVKTEQQKQPASNSSSSNEGGHPITKGAGSVKVRKAIDGLTFQLAQIKDITSQYKLEEGFKMMTLRDIENQYTLDFTKWKHLADQK